MVDESVSPAPVCVPCGLALRMGSRLYHGVCRGATQPCTCTHESLRKVMLAPSRMVDGSS